MNKKVIGYWVVTGFLGFALLGGGFMNISGAEEVKQSMAHLGYPAFVATILGFWKLSAAVALLLPGLARIKEWAYAGIGFAMTGAFVSHLAAGDAIGQAVPPLFVLALAIGSYVLRPASRRLVAPEGSSDRSNAMPAGVPSQA